MKHWQAVPEHRPSPGQSTSGYCGKGHAPARVLLHVPFLHGVQVQFLESCGLMKDVSSFWNLDCELKKGQKSDVKENVERNECINQ
eukprot:260652-Pelagomonas_calceolata.AAC.1